MSTKPPVYRGNPRSAGHEPGNVPRRGGCAPNAMGFRHLGGLGGGLGFLILVTVGSFCLGWWHAGGRHVVPGDGRFHGPAGGPSGGFCGVRAGQAGLVAKVVMASAIRLAVAVRLAWPKALGHFALRARCRFRSMTVRHFASALVWAV